jgi:acetylornithine/N-succinyldiaminopimelate aminotransferase
MTQKEQEIIDATQNLLFKTYAPQAVVMDHGKGCYAWDTEGRKYIDCAIGIAVASLGHAPPAVLETINTQAARLMACQSSYATLEKYECAKLLIDNSCFDLVYFANSGTETVEGALKCARKWAYEEKGPDCHEIIAFRKSFHGRSYGAASITEKRFSQEYFAPYLPGIHFAQFNDLESVKKLVNKKTAAIIVEPVQGEGGLTPASPCFLKGLRDLCDAENICLIYDEVQAGMGRMGTLFAYQSFACCGQPEICGGGANPAGAKPVEPDMACLAKGIGSGFPVGAIVAKEKFGKAIIPGSHGTTYGGNPLACAVAATVIKEMLKPGFFDQVRRTSKYFFDGLTKMQRESNKITSIRGKGLMVGVDTTIEIKKLLRALQVNGMMATQAGDSTLRITPPLIMTEKEAQEALDILKKTLEETA